MSGCLVNKIYKQIPPTKDALKEIDSIYIDQFNGKNSVLFQKILSHEIKKHGVFQNLDILPNISKKKAALLKVEVTNYFIEDVQEIRNRKKTFLVEKNFKNKNSSGNKKLKKEFNFIDKIYDEYVIIRTLDLEFSFQISTIGRDKTLYSDKEKASLKISYIGKENILLIPDSNDEMARISQLLFQKFLEKINPNPLEISIKLEKGTAPIPWTFGLIDFGHPRIIRSNHYASGERFKLALNGWNYVLFEPRIYPDSEIFSFNDDVFLRLKKAHLPRSILQTLFDIRGMSFDKDEINIVLLGLISKKNFERYSKIIKYHARFDKKNDRINLASAHYNLGAVYQLQNELELAAFHFAKANAFNPHQKYYQSWIEIQNLKGNYNPQKGIHDISIESLGDGDPPEKSLLNPIK